MQFLSSLLLSLVVIALHSDEISTNVYCSIDGLLYYFDKPSNSEYPILIVIEGSYQESLGPTSVFRLHSKFVRKCLDAKVGLISLERQGLYNDRCDLDQFHRYNTPTQRLSDHIRLVEHLKSSPPKNWNGQFIVLGGSEGANIAIKLSSIINPAACIPVVGCTEGTFRENIWDFLISKRKPVPSLFIPLINWWYELPADYEAYEALCNKMKTNPDHTKWWLGQTFHYWADALDQTIEREFLQLKCPVLVIAGSEDSISPPPNRIIQKAQENSQDVTYWCIDGMDHDALNPKWTLLERIFEFLQSKILR